METSLMDQWPGAEASDVIGDPWGPDDPATGPYGDDLIRLAADAILADHPFDWPPTASDVDSFARKYVDGILEADGGRDCHDRATEVARGLVRGFGLSVDDAWPHLLAFGSRCDSPREPHELRRELEQAGGELDDKPPGYFLDVGSGGCLGFAMQSWLGALMPPGACWVFDGVCDSEGGGHGDPDDPEIACPEGDAGSLEVAVEDDIDATAQDADARAGTGPPPDAEVLRGPEMDRTDGGAPEAAVSPSDVIVEATGPGEPIGLRGQVDPRDAGPPPGSPARPVEGRGESLSAIELGEGRLTAVAEGAASELVAVEGGGDDLVVDYQYDLGETLRTFNWLLKQDLWPIATHPPGVPRYGRGEPASGKEPLGGKGWGTERWTPERGSYLIRRNTGAGVGICLGKGRGPGGTWLIDVEGDGPKAEESRLKLFGGEFLETVGWNSKRGLHKLVIVDETLIEAFLRSARGFEARGQNGSGVYKLPDYPDLELRIGGLKPDGSVKQLQSVCPPTAGRIWHGLPEPVFLPAPECFYRNLTEAVGRRCGEATPRVVGRGDSPSPRSREREEAEAGREQGHLIKYALSGLRDEADKVASRPEGSRHDTLRDGALKVAGFVKAGALPEKVYREEMVAAGLACGLPADEVHELVESGLEKATPRDLSRVLEAQPTAPDGLEVAERVRRVIGEKGEGIPDLFRDEALMAGLADLRIARPDQYGAIVSELRRCRAFSPAEFKKAMDQIRPAKSKRPRPAPRSNNLPEFRNFTEEEVEGLDGDEDGEPKVIKVPASIREIDEFLQGMMPDYFKRVGDQLFCEATDHTPIYIDRHARLFSLIAEAMLVNWMPGGDHVSQEQFFERLRRSAPNFTAIETLPHWPRMPGVCYLHRAIPESSGKLDELVAFFNPATDQDRDLIKAMILTVFWGGPPGRRIAFLITGEPGDPAGGRGIGKSTLVDVIADELAKGSVDVSPTDEVAAVKTRLLSDLARQTRVARLDNVKSSRLSWADLEGLITASEISGKMLYKGEGRRPNNLVWFITMNGGTLSTDMAQRTATAFLKRPEFKPGWEVAVRDFAREHRWEIIGEALALLDREPQEITAATRWADWERSVLANCTSDLAGCQKLILDRQGDADADDEDKHLVRDLFIERLRDNGHNHETCHVLIRSKIAAEWLSDLHKKQYAPNAASAKLRQFGISELTPSRKENLRGWIWTGEKAGDRAKGDPEPLGGHPVESKS